MKLYTNEKEAQVIQIALAHLVAKDGIESETAQALLVRIAQCTSLEVKPVFDPFRVCASHWFTGGYDLLQK